MQKSGYFARSAKPNNRDLRLIKESAKSAVEFALDNKNGVVGRDIENQNKLGLINFDRIKGGKYFDYHEKWFIKILGEIKQK